MSTRRPPPVRRSWPATPRHIECLPQGCSCSHLHSHCRVLPSGIADTTPRNGAHQRMSQKHSGIPRRCVHFRGNPEREKRRGRRRSASAERQPLAGFASPRSRPDPRTAPMMEVIGQVLGRDRDFIRLVHAQQAALEVGSPMDFILTTLFVGHKLGITGEEYAITSVGRIVGWIAHAMEQQLHGELVRPRARYVGRLP
ncbi:hypothetical protein NECAME_16243 [Necator americanus]|uniref:Uncharacterized protein n=1 Tax=Necator americanus TaxID=51031 RepID=W2U017_NECAM|nr:hypothetical protein NECAME_16243 [Necator americanus]ETN86642.1 hypothetical protein NECAME_16243 [Necator americanus]